MIADLPLTESAAARLAVVKHSASTNAELRAASASDEWPHLSVLLTDDQRAGRGRLDRTWVTPAGSAVAISVLLRELPESVEARGWLPLAAGWAMADAVAAQLAGHEVGVKWPNDVLVDGRKICGILAEATPDAVIVGAGVNTAMTDEQLPVETATSFAVLGAEADPDRLVADYVRALGATVAALAAAPDAEAAGLHAALTGRCVTLGQDVTVSLPGGDVLQGTARRLDALGRLVVEAADGEHAVAAGDVVHVRRV